MINRSAIIIGGGTGSFIVLSGLKHYPVQLSALITVTDDGGSTGRLRDEFGFLPAGDMRQCIVALADENTANNALRKLLLYRFDQGEPGLIGHNLGNLILTALEDLAGSETGGLKLASKIFKLKGEIHPISLDLVKLGAKYKSGKTIISEHLIEEHNLAEGNRITKLFTKPKAKINPQAKKTISRADFIILGPGDLYGSTIANLVIQGVPQAIQQSSAKIIYILNLMTLKSQTHKYTAKDHLQEIEKYLGRKVDYILVNSQSIPAKIIKKYAQMDEHPIKDNLGSNSRVIRRKLLAKTKIQKSQSDLVKRSFLRHDSQKLAQIIFQLIDS
jgi:uncharacterized cofD-like protein